MKAERQCTLRVLVPVCLLLLGAVSCVSGASHAASLRGEEDKRLTAGEVQRNIKVGMSGAEVAQSLGSPNIVTTDEERREVWIYDRVSTERVYSTDEGGLFLLLAGVSGSSGATSTSQRTLTVIIKFDAEGKVRDFAYHASRF